MGSVGSRKANLADFIDLLPMPRTSRVNLSFTSSSSNLKLFTLVRIQISGQSLLQSCCVPSSSEHVGIRIVLGLGHSTPDHKSCSYACSQTAQYGFSKEYTLNHCKNPDIIQGVLLIKPYRAPSAVTRTKTWRMLHRAGICHFLTSFKALACTTGAKTPTTGY